MALKPLETDFSILEQIGFALPPVGIKFEFFEPAGVEHLDGQMALCEMPRTAQLTGKKFYMDRSNENCMGKGCLGMMDDDPSWGAAGLIGSTMGTFKDAGANMRCMKHYTTFRNKSVNYVVFAPLPALDFEPDMIICTGDVLQCGAIMRAMAYSTGELIESKSTPVFQCAWMFSYPFLENKINFITLGMGHGTTARECYGLGEIMTSVPSTWFGTILQNLKDMGLTPEAWAMGREKWAIEEEKIYDKIISDTREAGLL